jgi:hypothetical protein
MRTRGACEQVKFLKGGGVVVPGNNLICHEVWQRTVASIQLSLANARTHGGETRAPRLYAVAIHACEQQERFNLDTKETGCGGLLSSQSKRFTPNLEEIPKQHRSCALRSDQGFGR